MKVPYYIVDQDVIQTKQISPNFLIKEADINHHLIWEAIVTENANMRQGTHKAKTRAEVRGGGRKPWKQKGTGHARAGSIRSPIWKGGGVAFGPVQRTYNQKINKRKKRIVYKHIVSHKINQQRFILLSDLVFDKISTAMAFQVIDKLIQRSPFYKDWSGGKKIRTKTNGNRKKITLITESDNVNLKKSFKNLPWISLIHVDRLAARYTFYNHALLFTESAFEKFNTKKI